MKKRLSRTAAALLTGLLLSAGCGREEPSFLEALETEASLTESQDEPAELKETEAPPETEESTIYVYVCGEVKAPGVYMLPRKARIYEALEAAGGLTEEASPWALNQAGTLTDGDMLYVPKEGEESADPGNKEARETDDGRVNINTADRAALMTLPGIGDSKASAILSYREANGPFSDISDIKKIAGIKDGVYTKIKDYIKV